jgi:MAF protein
MKLILASSSPRRQALIASLGLGFDVIRPDVDEAQRPGERPLDYVRRLSQDKAEAVFDRVKSADSAVLAADTIVVLAADTIGLLAGDDRHGVILGKPGDAAEARAMLRQLRDRPHRVYTAFTLISSGGRRLTDLSVTTVWMRPYTDDEIEAYIATGDPFDKAGSYAIQHAGFHPVARIEGCPNNVVGLPLCAVRRALYDVGFTPIKAPIGCDCAPPL